MQIHLGFMAMRKRHVRPISRQHLFISHWFMSTMSYMFMSVSTAGVHATCSHKGDIKRCWSPDAGSDPMFQGILGKSVGVMLDADIPDF